jgi:enoyl-[acyl-carrier protein] reductase II
MSVEELELLGSGKYPEAALRGDIENGSILAGQVVGLVNRVEPAREIVISVMNEAEALLKTGLGVDLCLD